MFNGDVESGAMQCMLSRRSNADWHDMPGIARRHCKICQIFGKAKDYPCIVRCVSSKLPFPPSPHMKASYGQWVMKENDRKRVDAFQMWCYYRRLLGVSCEREEK